MFTFEHVSSINKCLLVYYMYLPSINVYLCTMHMYVARLWNDIIRTLRTGLPLRKQKKGLRTYEECIGSAELIEWLHKSLQKNVNFGPDVTRDQTVQLLKKLYRC